MKLFVFNKPKQTVINILFTIALMSLFISFLAIGTVVLWKYYPKTVSKIDKLIPNFYGDNIKDLYKKAKESEKENNRFIYFSKLYGELEDVSTLNKYYKYRQESANYLIDYYLKNGKKDKAFSIAEEWEQKYPYDFTAKFVYLNVLLVTNKMSAEKYISNLYNRYPDIQEVVQKKVSFLIESENINEAILIEMKNKDIDNISFQVFYIDEPKTVFNAKQSITFFKDAFEKNNDNYSLVFKHKFKKLKGLRFDVDNLSIGSIVKISNISISLDNKVYSASIKSANQMEQLDEKRFKINGGDPYFILELKNEILNFKGEVQVSFFTSIKKPSALNLLGNKSEWQLFYADSKVFSEKKSKKLSLSRLNNGLKVEYEFNNSVNMNYIRLDLPSIKNLKFRKISIILNDSDLLDEKNIEMLHSISNENGYIVTGDDPYIVFKNEKNINIKKIYISVEM